MVSVTHIKESSIMQKLHKIKLGKYAFEEYIIFDICEASKDEYLTRITIEIAE